MEISVRTAVSELNEILAIDATHFSGSYWMLAERAFHWHYPPTGAGIIHLPDGGISFEFPSVEQMKILRRILIINGCVDVLCAVLSKVEFMTDLKKNSQIDDNTWFRYVQSDIHTFHAEMRSLFDTIAVLLTELSPESHGGDSFARFRDMTSPFSRKKQTLTPEIKNLVAHCDWFDQLRNTRDAIMHDEKDAWVLWRTDDHILFKLTYGEKFKNSGLADNRCLKYFLWHDWIDFRPYAGYYIGRLIAFLNKLTMYLTTESSVPSIETSITWRPNLVQTSIRYVAEARQVLAEVNQTAKQKFDRNWDRAFSQPNW